jgi:hypothetical protein
LNSEKLFSSWRQDKPYILLGVLHLLAEALSKRELCDIQDGRMARRVWFNLADSLFYTEKQIVEVRQERDKTIAVQSFEQSPFSLGFVAFLQDLEKQNIFEIRDRISHIMNAFNHFIFSRTGETISINFEGEIIKWQVTPGQVTTQSPVGFGWNIAKYAQIIEQMAGWVACIGKNQKGPTKYLYKIGYRSIEDILLDL